MEELRFHPWFRIPQEMRDRNQWVAFKIVQKDGKEIKLPINPLTGREARIDDPSTWTDFHTAATSPTQHIGFAFTEEDPFIFIDLDTGKVPEEIRPLHHMLIDQAGTYCEVSNSGKGYHIFTQGELPFAGTNDHTVGIEIYRSGRFALVTGDQIEWEDIYPQQELIDLIIQHMPNKQDKSFSELVSIESGMTDEEVYEKAARAVNGHKFVDLWEGNWQHYSELNGDHSTADLSLLTFLDHYCKDVEQVIRMFMTSALYRPEKGRKSGDGSDYILRSLNQARMRNERDEKARQLSPEEEAQRDMIVSNGLKRDAAKNIPAEVITTPHGASKNQLQMPHGPLGELVDFVYRDSYKPILDLTIPNVVTVLSAWLTGRVKVQGNGLALYTVVTGAAAVGKSSSLKPLRRLASVDPSAGMTDWNRARSSLGSVFSPMVDFGSRQGLSNAIDHSDDVTRDNSALVILDDCSGTIGRWFNPAAGSFEQGMSKGILELFESNGPHSVFGGFGRAKKEETVSEITNPGLALLGNSVPSEWNGTLGVKKVLDGTVSRLLVMEHKGDEPYSNLSAGSVPVPDGVVSRLITIHKALDTLLHNGQFCHIQMEPAVKERFINDERTLTDERNSLKSNDTNGAMEVGITSRRMTKIIRVAAILAAYNSLTENYCPRITMQDYEWATHLVKVCERCVLATFEDGDAGADDDVFESKIKSLVKRYVSKSDEWKTSAGKAPKGAKRLPKYFVSSTWLKNNFTKEVSHIPTGFKSKVDVYETTIRRLVEADILIMVDKKQLEEMGCKRATHFVAGVELY